MEQRVEGFGISLCEASACGMPVVAGRSGGIPEAVRDGETGILVDAESAGGRGRARSGRLLDDRSLRARLGAAGRRAVESSLQLGPGHRRAGRASVVSSARARARRSPVVMPHALSAPAAAEEYDRQYQRLGRSGRGRGRSIWNGA